MNGVGYLVPYQLPETHYHRPRDEIVGYQPYDQSVGLTYRHELAFDRQELRPPAAGGQAYKKLYALRDQHLRNAGDHGWPLNYATAFCYRHITKNRNGIVSAINHARRAAADKLTAYLAFDLLDRAIFAGKLHEMVFLRWQPMEIDHPGVTFAPGKRAARTCICLNSTPFEHGAEIDELLQMLIHQMIHAYFLACCGAPKQDSKLDGRLLDDVQFGVLVLSINDVTQSCDHGTLGLIFHAHRRHPSSPLPHRSMRTNEHGFIALDPEASSPVPSPYQGHSCCQLDNRSITLSQVYNWQVEYYSKAIGDNWDSRGDVIFVPDDDALTQVKRIAGPPSAMYEELIWDGKRIIVSKERAAKYSTLARMGADNKYNDVKLPDCQPLVLQCLCTFIELGTYMPDPYHPSRRHNRPPGPPILLSPQSRQGEDITLHVRVCKLADAMRFPELQEEAIKHLTETPFTSDDPIAVLKLIYDGLVAASSELRDWCRKFLCRTDHPASAERYDPCHGASNYEKIMEWHAGRFSEPYAKHKKLRDDCELAIACLAASRARSVPHDWPHSRYVDHRAAEFKPDGLRPRHTLHHLPPNTSDHGVHSTRGHVVWA